MAFIGKNSDSGAGQRKRHSVTFFERIVVDAACALCHKAMAAVLEKHLFVGSGVNHIDDNGMCRC